MATNPSRSQPAKIVKRQPIYRTFVATKKNREGVVTKRGSVRVSDRKELKSEASKIMSKDSVKETSKDK